MRSGGISLELLFSVTVFLLLSSRILLGVSIRVSAVELDPQYPHRVTSFLTGGLETSSSSTISPTSSASSIASTSSVTPTSSTSSSFSSTENYACSAIRAGHLCVSQNCVWCATDQQCHAPGSFANPCTNSCCASKSFRSSCWYWKWTDIPGECVVPALNTSGFSAETAWGMLMLSAASYCNQSSLQGWDCRPCRSAPHFKLKAVLQDPDMFLQAIVGVTTIDSEYCYCTCTGESTPSPMNERIVIAFRGTTSDSLIEWVANLKYLQVSPYHEFPDIKVHSGFYTAYTNSLQKQVLDTVQSLPSLPVMITGHSLGGALAMLCAWDLKVYYGIPISSVYTFGQPRTGNFKFATTYAKMVPNIWRATHRRDIVPHVPPPEEDYFHPQFEVYYPEDDLNYVLCDSSGEDDTCSNVCASSILHPCTSIDDHLNYLNFSLGASVCG